MQIEWIITGLFGFAFIVVVTLLVFEWKDRAEERRFHNGGKG